MLPLGVAAQSIHIMPGAKLVANGPVNMVLNNMAFTNDGDFIAGNSRLVFTGNANNTVAAINGSISSSFNNITINKSSGDLQLNNDIAIAGVINMLAGNLLLNSHNVNLGGTGSIAGENNQSHISGIDGGSVFATGKLIPGSSLNPGNIGAELLTDADLGIVTVERRHVSETLPDGSQSIDRTFDISPGKTPAALNLRLRFFYLDTELEGNSEADLMFWTRSGAGNFMIPIGKDSSNVTTNMAVKNGLDQIGHFTLASNQGGPATRDNARVAINTITTGTALRVFPNPVRNTFNIELTTKREQLIRIGLYDQAGHLLQQKEIPCVAGLNTIQWNLNAYPRGIYYLSVKNQELKNIKIIKE